MEKPAKTDVPINELIAGRYSPRAFDPDRPVERGKIALLLEAARWAPSSYNEQPWRFVLFDGANPEALAAARGCLASGNAYALKAPLLLLACAKERFDHKGRPNPHGRHDLGQAVATLALQATELGLSVHQMAGFDAERAGRRFNVPEGFTPLTMLAVGYTLPNDADTPEVKADRERVRERRPVSEFAFGGGWDEPWP